MTARRRWETGPMRRVECALSSRVVREPYPHTVWSYRLECQHLADSDTEGRSHVACPVCLVDDRAPPPVSEIANRGVGAGSRVSETVSAMNKDVAPLDSPRRTPPHDHL